MNLKERLQKREKRISEESGKLSVWHSVSYHKHFEGYVEYYIPKKNGKGRKLQHVYIGEYYHQELTLLQRRLLCFIYIMLFIGGVSACLWGGSISVESNQVWYVNLPEALALPCIFWTFLALLTYLKATRTMKKGSYQFAVRGIRMGTLCSCLCMMFSMLASVVYAFLHGNYYDPQALFSIGLLFASGVEMLTMHLIERRITYTLVENSVPLPPGSAVL